MKMLVSMSTAAGFQLILSWAIMVVKECCSLVGICVGSIEVPAVLSSFPKASMSSHFLWLWQVSNQAPFNHAIWQ